MKLRNSFVFGAALTVGLSVAGTAEAQQRAWDVSLGAGPSFPMSKLGDEAQTGYNVQGFVGYRLPMFPAKIRVGVLYQDFDAQEREPSIDVSLGGEWY